MTNDLAGVRLPQAGDRQLSAAFIEEVVARLSVLLRADGAGLEVAGQTLQLRQEDQLPDVFVSRIPGAGSGSGAGYYGWVRQRPASGSPGWEDLPNGGSGAPDRDPVVPLGGPRAGAVGIGDYVVQFPGWHQAVGSGSGASIERGWHFIGGRAGDRIEIVEPHDTGVAPPDPLLLDGRTLIAHLAPVSLTAGELAWLLDVNSLPAVP